MLVLRCYLDIQILMFSLSLDLVETKARNNYLINGEQMVFKDQLYDYQEIYQKITEHQVHLTFSSIK